MKKRLLNLIFAGVIFISHNTCNPSKIPNSLIEIIKNPENTVKIPDGFKPHIPFEKELRKIENSEYALGKNDCRHKSLRYLNILRENKIPSYVVGGWIFSGKENHAMVYYQDKNTKEWLMADPTSKNNRDGFPVKASPKKYIYRIFGENYYLDGSDVEEDYSIVFPENKKEYEKYLNHLKNEN